MKPSTTAIMTAAGATSASAMAPFFNTTSTQPFHCPAPFGVFCAGPSMSQNLLIECAMGKASPINCIEHTAAQAPIDDYNARCYESAPSAGDAGCAKESMVYPISGDPYPLPAGQQDASLPETPTLTASAGVETAFPMPANLTHFPMPTQGPPHPPPAGLASLPKASLPAYVTTITIGTQTQWHTVFSNCGNGTMLFGTGTATASTSFASWQTGSIPGELASSELQPSTSAAALAPNTVPCDPSTSYGPIPTASGSPSEPEEPTSSDTSTVSWAVTPTASSFTQSWVHPTDYATVTVVAPAASSFVWSSGEVAAPSSTTSTSVSTATTLPTEYPSAISSAGFQSGEDDESSASRGGAPSLWVMGFVVGVVVAWGC